LVFWTGDPKGSIHVCEFKESLLAVELGSLIQKHNRECCIYEVERRHLVFSASERKLLRRGI
jgi:hypothetical protein